MTGLRARVLVVALCLGGTVTALQGTLLVPVLPNLPRELGTSPATVSWLVTATLLAGAVATPVASRLADMYGKRQILLSCLAISIAGSLLGALSHGVAEAVAARAMQGVGVVLIPVGIAVMRDELPPARVPSGIALLGATLAMGGGLGLPLAGLVAQGPGWRALFWITGGAAAVVFCLVLAAVPRSDLRSGGTFDHRGAILLSAALVALLLALTKGGTWGWTSAATAGCAAAGAVLLAVWLPVELRAPRPLVDVRLAGRPALLLVNGAAALAGFGMFTDPLVTTQLLQAAPSTGYGHGLDATATGLLLAPGSLAFGLAAPLAAHLVRRYGPEVAFCSGALCMGVSYAARTLPGPGLGWILTASLAVSAGASLAFGALPSLVLALSPASEAASASGLNALMRSLGTSTASAVVAAAAGGAPAPSYGVLNGVFLGAALACLLAAAALGPLLLGRTASRVPGAMVDRGADRVG
ncbi:MFS transporter [Streptomyces sp. NPDC088387]|uniref:MFS transporter n=1 Tax=Streptomyces sp. NPDC088387 TaxID=3365859 RepID=UPI003804FDE2